MIGGKPLERLIPIVDDRQEDTQHETSEIVKGQKRVKQVAIYKQGRRACLNLRSHNEEPVLVRLIG